MERGRRGNKMESKCGIKRTLMEREREREMKG